MSISDNPDTLAGKLAEALEPFVSEDAVYLTGDEAADKKEGVFPTVAEILFARAALAEYRKDTNHE